MNTQTILPRHLARINNVTFNYVGNGRTTLMATGSWDKSVRVYELNNLSKEPIVLNDHKDWVWSICFSGDGSKLLAGCKDNLIRVWPTTVEAMKGILKTTGKVNRNMSIQEWDRHVSKDIDYARTFSNKKDGEGVKLKTDIEKIKKTRQTNLKIR